MKKPIPSWFTGWLVSLFVVRSKIHQEYRWYASKTPYKVSPINSINRSTLWLFNVAMENPWTKWRFLAGKIFYKWAIYTMAMLVITRGYIPLISHCITIKSHWTTIKNAIKPLVFERWLNGADSTGALKFPPQFQDILRLGRRRRRWRRAQQGLLQDLRELDWKPRLRWLNEKSWGLMEMWKY